MRSQDGGTDKRGRVMSLCKQWLLCDLRRCFRAERRKHLNPSCPGPKKDPAALGSEPPAATVVFLTSKPLVKCHSSGKERQRQYEWLI